MLIQDVIPGSTFTSPYNQMEYKVLRVETNHPAGDIIRFTTGGSWSQAILTGAFKDGWHYQPNVPAAMRYPEGI